MSLASVVKSSKLFPLTPSKMASCETCMYKTLRTYVVGDVPFVKTRNMEFGDVVHKHLEYRISQARPLPPWLAELEADVSNLLSVQSATYYTERFHALDPSLTRIIHQGRNSSEPPLLRLKTDFERVSSSVAIVVDWKTGSVRDDRRQLKIEGLAAFAQHPEVQAVVPLNKYVKWDTANGKPDPFNCNATGMETKSLARAPNSPQSEKAMFRKDIHKYIRELLDEISFIAHSVENDIWEKNQTPLCGWCSVEDCEYWHIDPRNKG